MGNKKLKGFTLIEMIVVIAIIGVLAAILVPQMVGYVQKAKYQTANANAKHIFDTLYTTALDNDILNDASGISDIDTPTSIKSVYDSLTEDQKKKLNLDLAGYFAIKVDNVGYPKVVAWSKTDNSSDIVGRYPKPTEINDGVDWTNWNT